MRVLVDGDSTTGLDVTPGADPAQLVLEFARPYRARSLTLRATADDTANYVSRAMVRVEASDDGRTYRPVGERSEEHTSELQSLMRISYAVFCLKKKKKRQQRQQL